MKASDYIISFLESKGSNTFFSYSWGMITHLEDSIFLKKTCKIISVRHEQAGAFAAEGFTRITWKTWVALATSWPGATNLITWIASAYFDSIPVLYITWQVRSDELTPLSSWVRQTGFQETKIVPIVKPITKYACHIGETKKLRYELEKAFFYMHSGRKWPALLDISMDVQKNDVNPDDLESYFESDEYKNALQIDNIWDNLKSSCDLFFRELQDAKRPILLVWWWIRTSDWVEELQKFIKHSKIPVVASLMWIDAVSSEYEWYVGMIGSYGVRHANIALSQTDLVIVIWSRLDLRQTGAMKDKFIEHGKIIHIDIDKEELGYNIKHTQYKIHADLLSFLTEVNKIEFIYPDFSTWHSQIKELKKLLPTYESKLLHGEIHPNYFFERLSKILPNDTFYVNDVGQNQMWSSQSLSIKEWWRLLNSWWLGSMWFSLPAAIGAVCAVNERARVISINGDGWFQMNIQELETISLRKLPVWIIILNNASLGMVREFQDTYFEGRNIGTIIGYSCPEIERIAYAYQLPYFYISNLKELEAVLSALPDIIGPYIIELKISQKAIVEPKMLYGNTLDKQIPALPSDTEERIKNIFS